MKQLQLFDQPEISFEETGLRCIEQTKHAGAKGFQVDFAKFIVQRPWHSSRRKLSWAVAGAGRKHLILHIDVEYDSSDDINFLPTPAASDWKGAYPPSSLYDHPGRVMLLRSVYCKIPDHEYNAKTSQLNPQLSEEMMGFPHGWTEIPFSKEKGHGNP